MSVFVSEEECPAADGQADQERREKKSSVTFFGDRSRSHSTVTGSVGGGFLDRLVICFGGSGCGLLGWLFFSFCPVCGFGTCFCREDGWCFFCSCMDGRLLWRDSLRRYICRCGNGCSDGLPDGIYDIWILSGWVSFVCSRLLLMRWPGQLWVRGLQERGSLPVSGLFPVLEPSGFRCEKRSRRKMWRKPVSFRLGRYRRRMLL